MSSYAEPQPDAWQQNAVFTELLQAPAAKQALASLETHLKPIFNSHALYSLETGHLIVKLHSLTSLLNCANLLPHLTPHDFKLGLHLAITPSLSQSASPCKDQPLHFDAFLNAVAFCAFYYPPLKDPSQTPKPRLPNESMSHLEHMLDTACERLVAATESPRSIVAKVSSPASSVAFNTPYTTFPEESPIDTVSSGVSASPGGEVWFTPAPSAIRTRLFQFEEVDTLVAPDLDVETENRMAHIGSFQKIKSEICSETFKENDIKRSAGSDPSESSQELPTDTSNDPMSETSHGQPESESCSYQNTEVPTFPADEPQISQNISPRKFAESELEESSAQQTPCEESKAASPAPSPSTRAPVVSTPQAQIPDELTDNPGVLAETNESGSRECASIDLSLAPSTALSHLPSPESHFESPHLSCDAQLLQGTCSSGPTSSRKLSFSDSESDTDSSSCYDHRCDDQDTMTRIENAFDNSCLVEECDDCDEELCSDMISPYSPCPYVREADDTIVIRTMKDEDQQYCSSKQLSCTASPENEAGTASHLPAQNSGSALSPDSEPVLLDGEDVYDMSKVDKIGENDFSCVFDVTQDVNLNEPKITLGLPAVAFSEAGGGILRTPLTQGPRTRLDDTDMGYEDEEDHTLLFDDGNESDGSELSMGTRETMRKLVEDHLSLHGTASSQRYQSGHFYAEDQVLVTPDRKSHVAFCDRFTTTYNAIVEDGPFASEKAETRRSRMTRLEMTRLETDQVLNSMEECDRETKGFRLTRDTVEQDANCAILSPAIGSRRGSYSSEITPDGLNLIKKQLVLPHPFVPTGSTVGSSISSAPGTQDEMETQRNENVENNEDQRIVTVSPKKNHMASEKTAALSQQDVRASARELEILHVMRETLETCRVLREEIARKQQRSVEYAQQRNYRGFGRFMEFGLFGLVIVIVSLVLVERRIQRGVFVDVLV